MFSSFLPDGFDSPLCSLCVSSLRCWPCVVSSLWTLLYFAWLIHLAAFLSLHVLVFVSQPCLESVHFFLIPNLPVCLKSRVTQLQDSNLAVHIVAHIDRWVRQAGGKKNVASLRLECCGSTLCCSWVKMPFSLHSFAIFNLSFSFLLDGFLWTSKVFAWLEISELCFLHLTACFYPSYLLICFTLLSCHLKKPCLKKYPFLLR